MAKQKFETGPIPLADINERSIDELLGNNVPKKSKKTNSVSVTFSGQPTLVVPDRLLPTEAEKALKAQAKRMLADYQQKNIQAMIDLAENTDNDIVEFNTRRWIAEQTLGKAPNAPSEQVSTIQYPSIKVDWSGDTENENDSLTIEGHFEPKNLGVENGSDSNNNEE